MTPPDPGRELPGAFPVFPLSGALLLSGACQTTDGTPSTLSGISGLMCSADTTCGAGRYCGAAGLCALDCVSDGDCVHALTDPSQPNPYTCSPCGRCVLPGVTDTTCLPATDRPCTTASDCANLGSNYACDGQHLCAPACTSDAQCQLIGHGWACGSSGLCERTCTSDLQCHYFGWDHSCALPSGVDPTANAVAANPVQGQCIPSPNGVGFSPPPDPAPPSYAYQGVWGWLFVASVQTNNVPLVSQINTSAIQLLLVKLTSQTSDLQFDAKWCSDVLQDFNPDDSPPAALFTINIPDRNLDNILEATARVVNVPSQASGVSFDTTELLDLRGAILSDPLNDPLPTVKDLSHQWDQDRDGNPGMTSDVTGLLTGQLYQAQRTRATFHAQVYDADHWGGLVTTLSNQTIVGASTPLLVNSSTTTDYTDQPDRTYFRAQRLQDTASCDDVRTLSMEAGSWLSFVPHFQASHMP